MNSPITGRKREKRLSPVGAREMGGYWGNIDNARRLEKKREEGRRKTGRMKTTSSARIVSRKGISEKGKPEG